MSILRSLGTYIHHFQTRKLKTPAPCFFPMCHTRRLRPLDVPPRALLQLAAFWQWRREEAAKLLGSIVLSNFQKKQASKDQKHLPPKNVSNISFDFYSASPHKNVLLTCEGFDFSAPPARAPPAPPGPRLVRSRHAAGRRGSLPGLVTNSAL